jgi:hypothetical protein
MHDSTVSMQYFFKQKALEERKAPENGPGLATVKHGFSANWLSR